MSSKVNIFAIVSGHFVRLSKANGQFSISDFATFIFIPVLFAALSIVFQFNLNKDIVSLLVNFGAIFTALLLSVLVLVYDQESKIDDKAKEADRNKEPRDIFYSAKKDLLGYLYVNISYSIVCSLFLIAISFLNSVLDTFNADQAQVNEGIAFVSKVVLTPLAIFFLCNLLLTITMIVKRLHALLIMER